MITELRQQAARLVEQAGLGPLLDLTPLPGGRNNQVYLVRTSASNWLLKVYFRDAGDPRDRLAAESAFAEFAWSHGVRAMARPIAFDREARLGLYEFIAGRALTPDEVDADAVDQAAAFFTAINKHRGDEAALRLPNASEACFSLSDHLACVERRIERLKRNAWSPQDAAAAELVERELAPAWQTVRVRVERLTDDLGLSRDEPRDVDERCLSPSDFGFHNALRDADGRLRFIDFEYAGWDDPAKLICDFFCQPAVPVPPQYFERFAERVVGGFPDRPAIERRVDLLLPVYRLKWCCILLNEFLPDGDRRRSFARAAADVAERKRTQLDKARTMLAASTTESMRR